jgi:hypothetical protein
VRALCWHGKNDVRLDTVPDPKIQEPTDVIIKITSTAICGSDLHLYEVLCWEWRKATCSAISQWASLVRWAARWQSSRKEIGLWCPSSSPAVVVSSVKSSSIHADTTNPDAEKASKLNGALAGGTFRIFTFSRELCRGQAEYLRVLHADVRPLKIESDLSDEKVLFRSDIFPTGYMAENACFRQFRVLSHAQGVH